MLNIIDQVKFSYDSLIHGKKAVLDIKCATFNCGLTLKTYGLSEPPFFHMSELRADKSIMRVDMTVIFTAVITCMNDSTIWVKHTFNLNKAMKNRCECGRSGCRNAAGMVIKCPPFKPSEGDMKSYVGGFTIIGPPSLNDFDEGGDSGSAIHFKNTTEGEGSGFLNPNDTLHDVTFVMDDGSKVHGCKALLSTISPTFNAMFGGRFKEMSELPIPDTSEEAMKDLVQFSVTRSFNVVENRDNMAFVELCHRYMITHVVNTWCRYMLTNVNRENAPDLFRAGRFLGNQRLVNVSIRCIRGNTHKIDLSQFDKDELVEILKVN
jgi:hypothetical protein